MRPTGHASSAGRESGTVVPSLAAGSPRSRAAFRCQQLSSAGAPQHAPRPRARPELQLLHTQAPPCWLAGRRLARSSRRSGKSPGCAARRDSGQARGDYFAEGKRRGATPPRPRAGARPPARLRSGHGVRWHEPPRCASLPASAAAAAPPGIFARAAPRCERGCLRPARAGPTGIHRQLPVPPHIHWHAPREASATPGSGRPATRARDPHTEVSRIRVPVASLQGASARQHTQLAVLEEGIFGGHSRDPPAATPVEKASLQEKPAQQHPWRG